MFLAGAAFAALAMGIIPAGSMGGPCQPSLAYAQNLGQRVVLGTVIDAQSNPVPGATVFLRDLKTKLIRSYTSYCEGKFRFTQGRYV